MNHQEALRLVRNMMNEAVAQKSDSYYESKVGKLAKLARPDF